MKEISRKLVILSIVSVLLVSPIVITAQPTTLTGFVNSVIDVVLNILWSVAVAFVVIMFVLAGFKFFTAQGDISKVAEARQSFIWGLIGTAVIVLSWSIVAFVRFQLNV